MKFFTDEYAEILYLKGRMEEAQQSNFRALSLLTDPSGIVEIQQKLVKLGRGSSDQETARLTQALGNALLDLIRQTTYTGRCLGGTLHPNASIHTDQRAKTLRKQASSK